MFLRSAILASSLLAVVGLAACGKKPPKLVSQGAPFGGAFVGGTPVRECNPELAGEAVISANEVATCQACLDKPDNKALFDACKAATGCSPAPAAPATCCSTLLDCMSKPNLSAADAATCRQAAGAAVSASFVSLWKSMQKDCGSPCRIPPDGEAHAVCPTSATMNSCGDCVCFYGYAVSDQNNCESLLCGAGKTPVELGPRNYACQ